MIETFQLKMLGAWRSVTLWFNAVLLAMMPFVDSILQSVSTVLPTVSQWLTADILKGAAIFILIANIGLRFKTSKPLEAK